MREEERNGGWEGGRKNQANKNERMKGEERNEMKWKKSTKKT